jgi:Na+-driven multidrug efflux pump
VAYLLAVPLALGPPGAFMSIALAQATLAGIGLVLFRRGAWKQREV